MKHLHSFYAIYLFVMCKGLCVFGAHVHGECNEKKHIPRIITSHVKEKLDECILSEGSWQRD